MPTEVVLQRSGADCERSEQRGGCGRAKRAACGGVASEASGGGVWRAKRAAGGAAGRPRIVAEGDVLRVFNNMSAVCLHL